ncbi:hypothetical protein ZOSMA_161G00590 [Zostera marina]|uniref:Bromo domain-containing protein n=1 Tax=Zostera marina TaxID=29655 RepID=A0A0K9PUF8_ZOSMR|nr:hypothetical protein ZOSMA_161G00590 [Zostera marina]
MDSPDSVNWYPPTPKSDDEEEEEVLEEFEDESLSPPPPSPRTPVSEPMNLLLKPWTPDMWEDVELNVAKEEVEGLVMHVFDCIWTHPDSWPLFYPVDPKRLSDYYPAAKNPVDILVVRKRVNSGNYYVTLEMFVSEMRQLFGNWRVFKNVYSLYKVLANKMEVYMFEILKMDLKAIDDQKKVEKADQREAGEGSSDHQSNREN